MNRTKSPVWRNALLSTCLAAFGLGVIAFFAAMSWSRSELIPIAAALLPASLTAAAAIFAIQSWTESRAQSNDQKYRATLEAFVTSTTHINNIDFNVERPLRAQAVMWGSTQLIEQLARRSLYLDRMVNQSKTQDSSNENRTGGEGAPLTINGVAHLGWLTAEVICTARRDFGLPPVSARRIYEGMWATIGGQDPDSAKRPHTNSD